MGGLSEQEQAELSHQRDLEAGMEVPEVIALRASEVAQARHEHELMMSLLEITWEIRDGQLYSAQYQRSFSDIANPPENRRTAGYPPLPPHILENLLTAERLIVSGAVTTLCIISPSIDFQQEGSTKGQCYRWRIEDGKVRALCSDHSQEIELMRREVERCYGADLHRSLGGNTINGGGVFAATREDTPTRAEMAAIIRELGNEKLARQYQHASVYNEDLTPGQYLIKLTQIELSRLYAAFKEAGIDPNKNPNAALVLTERMTNEALQEIKAQSTSILKEGSVENSRASYQQAVGPTLSSHSLHRVAFIPEAASWSAREVRIASPSPSAQAFEFRSSYLASTPSLTATNTTYYGYENRVSRNSTINPVRYNADHFYRFVKDTEQELAKATAQSSSTNSNANTRNGWSQNVSSTLKVSSPVLPTTWSEQKVDNKVVSNVPHQTPSFTERFQKSSFEHPGYWRGSNPSPIYSSTRSVHLNSHSSKSRFRSAMTEKESNRTATDRPRSQLSSPRANPLKGGNPSASSVKSEPNLKGALTYKNSKTVSTSTLSIYKETSLRTVKLSQVRSMTPGSLRLVFRRIVTNEDKKPGTQSSLLGRIGTQLHSYMRKLAITESRMRLAALRMVRMTTHRLSHRILNRYNALRARIVAPLAKVAGTVKFFTGKSPLLFSQPFLRKAIYQVLAGRKWALAPLNAYTPLTLERVMAIFRRKKNNDRSTPLVENSQPIMKRLKNYWRTRRARRKTPDLSQRDQELQEWEELFTQQETILEEAEIRLPAGNFIPTSKLSEETIPKEELKHEASADTQGAVSGPRQNDASPVWRLDTFMQQI